jgi:flagellar basal-body rod modification protein FlgD
MTNSVSAISNDSSATQQTSADAKNVLGKDAFLKLLTAQLSNQDPTEPVDNQAFIAQLAQFSSLEQLQGVSSRLDSLLLAMGSSNQLGAASLVGKDVTFKTSGFDLEEGAAPALQANLSSRAAVVAIIQDSSGRAVRALDLGVHDAGTFDVGWDGRDGSGTALAPGHYTVKLAATGVDGSDVTVEARSRGRVRGASFDGDEATLLVGTNQVNMSDVVQITQS